MAIAYVGGQEAGRAGANSTQNITFALTGGIASTPAAGDLVIITAVVGSQGRNAAQAISGYTALGQLNPTATTYDTSLDVSWKFMGSTPDTTFTLPSTGNVADAQSYTVQVFRGVHATTPFDATKVPATGTGTSRPNPGSITPTTAGAWIVICGGGAAATGANYTAPANFTTNFLTGFDADTNDSLIGSGYWDGWTSGAVDPAAYTGGSNTANDSWAVYTLALRPAPDTQALTPSFFDDSTDTFYGPTAVKVAYPLTPALYTNDNTFYTQTLTQGAALDMQVSWVVFDVQASGNVNLLPALFENQATFYGASVTTGQVTLTASRYDNAQAFYAATVGRGAVAITPDRYDNAQSFYSAVISQSGGTQILLPGLYENISTFYTATVQADEISATIPPHAFMLSCGSMMNRM